jgi:low affinity Fe/Cu permease
MVLRNARAKTFTHVVQRLLIGLVISVIAAFVQYLLKLRNLSDTWKIVISVLTGPIFVGAYFFVKNLIREPALLHTEIVEASEQKSQQLRETYIDEVAGLRKQIQELELKPQPPKRTPAE